VDDRIVSRGDQGRHVERPTYCGPATIDRAPPPPGQRKAFFLEHGLGQELLELGVLGFEGLQALGVRDVQAAELATPEVITDLREPVFAAEVLIGVPASASRRKPMICSSVKRFFMSNLLVLVGIGL
jgi:hypothetical protein